MSEEQSSYRQIMKATSLFGGVQVFNILFAIIRSKIVAMLLGPAGMGIAGLLTSTTGLVSSLTNLGIGSSAVKDIAEANENGNNERTAVVVSIFRRIVWFTGLFGMFCLLIFSSVLSKMTFGNTDYTFAFIWLSVTLLFGQLASGQMVLLQGMRKLQYLAKANMAGTVIGLVVSAPLYFLYGIDGIVPAIIISSFISMLLAYFWGRKVQVNTVDVNLTVIKKEGSAMIKMGIMMSLSGLFSIFASYLLRVIISNKGGVEDVGLFNAGFAIIETYVGLVFTAMGTDYYPRLTAVHDKLDKLKEAVSKQAVIAVLILTPVIVIFIPLSPVVIKILYSSKFLPIQDMVNWAILGIFFRAVSWSMGFILLAKSDSKLFIKTALFFNILFLINNVIGYYFLGLKGLGISFLANYIFHFICLLAITKRSYKFNLEKYFYPIFIFGLIFCALIFAVSFISSFTFKYILSSIIFVIVLVYTYKELDKLMDLYSLFEKLIKKWYYRMSNDDNIYKYFIKQVIFVFLQEKKHDRSVYIRTAVRFKC